MKMKNLKYIITALSVFLLLGFSTNTQAVELFAIGQDFEGPRGMDDLVTTEEGPPQSILYSIDPATGVPTMIGETGFELCLGLDFEPATNRAFAVCNRIIEENGGFPGEGPIEEVMLGTRMEDVGQVLIMLDLDTGMGTEIGALGIELTDAGVTDVSFRSDGVLFGIVGAQSELEGPGGPEMELAMLEFEEVTLVRIDTNTGKALEVGPTGTGTSIDAIGFSPTNNLYHTTDNNLDEGTLNMLDHITGDGTNIDDLDYPAGFDQDGVINIVSSMDYATSSSQLFAMLVAQDLSDVGVGLEEIDPESRVEFAEGSFLGTADPETGAIELIGMTSEFGNNFLAIAALNRIERNVPTLSEYGLIATSVFLLLAAVIFLRRRQLKTQM